MPRKCLACVSPARTAIDKALVSGEPLRNIAKRVSISSAALFRHKFHVSQVIVKAGEKREERLGDHLLDEMRRVQRKAWDLLAKLESEGDHRGSIVALREVRECLNNLGVLFDKYRESEAAGVEKLSDAELDSRIKALLPQPSPPALPAPPLKVAKLKLLGQDKNPTPPAELIPPAQSPQEEVSPRPGEPVVDREPEPDRNELIGRYLTPSKKVDRDHPVDPSPPLLRQSPWQ